MPDFAFPLYENEYGTLEKSIRHNLTACICQAHKFGQHGQIDDDGSGASVSHVAWVVCILAFIGCYLPPLPERVSDGDSADCCQVHVHLVLFTLLSDSFLLVPARMAFAFFLFRSDGGSCMVVKERAQSSAPKSRLNEYVDLNPSTSNG
jgi:hypothetical protein